MRPSAASSPGALAETVLPDLLLQRPHRDAEPPRGLGAVLPVAAELLDDQQLLDPSHAIAELPVVAVGGGERRVARHLRREVHEVDRLAGLSERDGAFGLVLQLAHVARPGTSLEAAQRCRPDALQPLPPARVGPPAAVLRQEPD